MEETGPAEVKDGDAAHKKNHELGQFGCKYCKKKFSNCQALGGHQNAHKLERALSKNKAGMGNGIPGFGYQGNYNVYPYPNVFPTGQPYRELVPFTSPRPYAHNPFVGLGHTYPSWFRPETRNYEASRNQLIVPGYINPRLDNRGYGSVVRGVTSSNVTDSMSVLDDSRKQHKGNSELDLTLKL